MVAVIHRHLTFAIDMPRGAVVRQVSQDQALL
jgi:hypothetical protein